LNYRTFRRFLTVPLLAVEVSFDGVFELQAGDADILVSLPGQDVMWQKERLLNVAVPMLPASCDKVVWLDCDTVFESDDWPEQLSRLLDTFPLVQPFSRVHHLSRDANLDDPRNPSSSEFCQVSIPLALAGGRRPRDCMSGVRDQLQGSCVMGMGWAMRRELLARVGIYDACIVGGGTRPLVCAAYGCFDEAIRLNLFNERQAEHYLGWAEPFFQAVEGQAAAVDATLFHLWHGDLADRRYKERYQGLAPHDFDPRMDVALDARGVWRWHTDKPEMHRYVRNYFAARRDDG
jgi:hypothetical protein